MQTDQPIDALLLTTAHCMHCESVKRSLQKLLEEGLLQHLSIVDLQSQPALAKHYNVRSVPWLRLGSFILTGSHSESELRRHLLQLSQDDGVDHYLHRLLADNELNLAIAQLHDHPTWFKSVIRLAADPELDLKVRLGVSALIEAFAGDEVLLDLIPALANLAQSADPRLRADAAYFFALIPSPVVQVYLRALATDSDSTVREIAEDGLVGNT